MYIENTWIGNVCYQFISKTENLPDRLSLFDLVTLLVTFFFSFLFESDSESDELGVLVDESSSIKSFNDPIDSSSLFEGKNKLL